MKITESNSWEAKSIDGNVIKEVKILGSISRNGRTYPAETRQKAISLLENANVNLDHAKGVPAISARFGKLTNVHDTEKGTFGDLVFLKSHPFAPALVEAAETMPEILGLSIYGDGKTKKTKDGEIVESIDKIYSVDLVSTPATTKGLYEAVEDATDSKSVHWEGIKAAVLAAMDEEGEIPVKMKRIKDLLKSFEKLDGNEEEEEEDDKKEEHYNYLLKEKKCRELCETLGINAEPTLVEMLVASPDMEKAAKWVKGKSIVKTVKSINPEVKTEKTDLVQLLRGR